MNQTSAINALAIPLPVSIVASDSPVVDAFGRLRVSEPVTLLEVQNQYNTNSLRMEGGNSGAGVAPAFSANTRLVTLQVNAGGSGGNSFEQSYQYISYQPGKSHYILMTGVLGAGVAGAVKRFGYGDSSNGIFYEQNGTSGLRFNRRTSTSGSVVNNTVDQSDWNLDKFDGTGPSGVTINPVNCFILVIDLQYLGMGRVRIGFDIAGVIYYAHQFLNANVLTVPYMQSAALPILAEINATAALASPATAMFKCAAVVSEGGFELETGREFSTTGSVTAANGSRTQVLSLRPALTFNGITNRGLFVLETIEILSGGNPLLWELCIGVGFTVQPTFADVNSTYSFMQAGTGGTVPTLTNGIVIASGYVTSGGGALRSLSSMQFVSSYPITLNRAGAVRAMGTLTLLLTGLGNTSLADVSMNWNEVR